jgi:hypothetical protein
MLLPRHCIGIFPSAIGLEHESSGGLTGRAGEVATQTHIAPQLPSQRLRDLTHEFLFKGDEISKGALNRETLQVGVGLCVDKIDMYRDSILVALNRAVNYYSRRNAPSPGYRM